MRNPILYESKLRRIETIFIMLELFNHLVEKIGEDKIYHDNTIYQIMENYQLIKKIGLSQKARQMTVSYGEFEEIDNFIYKTINLEIYPYEMPEFKIKIRLGENDEDVITPLSEGGLIKASIFGVVMESVHIYSHELWHSKFDVNQVVNKYSSIIDKILPEGFRKFIGIVE